MAPMLSDNLRRLLAILLILTTGCDRDMKPDETDSRIFHALEDVFTQYFGDSIPMYKLHSADCDLIYVNRMDEENWYYYIATTKYLAHEDTGIYLYTFQHYANGAFYPDSSIRIKYSDFDNLTHADKYDLKAWSCGEYDKLLLTKIRDRYLFLDTFNFLVANTGSKPYNIIGNDHQIRSFKFNQREYFFFTISEQGFIESAPGNMSYCWIIQSDKNGQLTDYGWTLMPYIDSRLCVNDFNKDGWLDIAIVQDRSSMKLSGDSLYIQFYTLKEKKSALLTDTKGQPYYMNIHMNQIGFGDLSDSVEVRSFHLWE